MTLKPTACILGSNLLFEGQKCLIKWLFQKAFLLTALCEVSNILNMERLHIRVLKNSNICRKMLFI